MRSEHLIFIVEPWMYEAGEISQYYGDLGVPYHMPMHTDLARVWNEAGNATHLVLARASLPASVFTRLPRLQAIVKWGRGIERIDLKAASQCGVLVAYTPFAVRGVAEAALLLMLALSKNLLQQVEASRSGKRADDLPAGSELRGKTLGIIGFGAIGQSLARMARGIGMRVLIYTHTPDPEAAVACNGQFVSLEELLASADYVSIHATASPDGRSILNARHIAQMKTGACFINTARGSLVDEKALIAALESGRLDGAGLDVVADEPVQPNNPLVHMDNVIVTPHALGYTRESMLKIKRAVREALQLLLAGGLPSYIANPEVVEAWAR